MVECAPGANAWFGVVDGIAPWEPRAAAKRRSTHQVRIAAPDEQSLAHALAPLAAQELLDHGAEVVVLVSDDTLIYGPPEGLAEAARSHGVAFVPWFQGSFADFHESSESYAVSPSGSRGLLRRPGVARLVHAPLPE